MEDWLIVVAMLIGGLVLLVAGGECVVRGSVGVARRLGVSELMIGLTLVGFGTSSPELATSLGAALSGSPGISIGNVVGSNIANVLLIFALVAIVRPIVVDPQALQRDGWVMLLAALGFIVVALTTGEISRVSGGVFVAALIAYLYMTWMAEKNTAPAAPSDAAEAEPARTPFIVSAGIAILGLVLLVVGADFLVGGAKKVATAMGVSETIVGLTIVAIGTSLPELVASLVAALKGRSAIAFGGIIGSNIYNILGIIGITALVKPIEIPLDLQVRDWAAMYVATLLILLHANTGGRVSRVEGGFLLLHYVAYCVWLMA